MDTKEFGAMLREVSRKIDEIKDDLSEIKQTQTAQAKDIEHHIKRTDLLEVRIEKAVADIKPLTEQRFKLQGVYGFLLMISVLLGMGVAWSKLKEEVRDNKNIRHSDK